MLEEYRWISDEFQFIFYKYYGRNLNITINILETLENKLLVFINEWKNESIKKMYLEHLIHC